MLLLTIPKKNNHSVLHPAQPQTSATTLLRLRTSILSHILPPHRPITFRHSGPLINTSVLTARILISRPLLRVLSSIPRQVLQQIIQPKRQKAEFILLQVLGIVCTQVDRSSNPAHDSNFMRIDHSPGSSETGVVSALNEPEPGDDEDVVGERVAKLVPPVFANDFGLVDFIN